MPNKSIDTQNLLPAITKRFVQVCLEIVANNKLENGPYKSARALLQTMGMSDQSFFLIKTGKPTHNVTIAQVATICKLHGVNPTFIILGTLPKFTTENAQQIKLIALEQTVKKLQKQIAEKPVKKVAKKEAKKK